MVTKESKRFGPMVRRPNLGSNAPKKAKPKKPTELATTPQAAKAAARPQYRTKA